MGAGPTARLRKRKRVSSRECPWNGVLGACNNDARANPFANMSCACIPIYPLQKYNNNHTRAGINTGNTERGSLHWQVCARNLNKTDVDTVTCDLDERVLFRSPGSTGV